MTRRVFLLATFVAVLVLGLAAAALAQSIAWVSTGPNDSGGEYRVAVSDSGRFVAFRSSAPLISGDTNGVPDVYVRDMQTGSVERVSISSTGAQSDGDSGAFTVDISGDGRYVLFNTNANLATGATGSGGKLYVRDRQTNATTLITREDGTLPVSSSTIFGAISGNGRYVAFSGPDYVTGQAAGVFVLDRNTGIIDRLDGGAFDGHYHADSVAISDNGRYVAFESRAMANEDIIRYDRQTRNFQIANPRVGGAEPQSRYEGWISMSGNGRFVAFGSDHTNLVGGGSANTMDVFVFDAQTGNLQRIAAHAAGGGAAFWPNPALSSDGRYVAFSAGNTSWVKGWYDIVLYDRNNGTAQSLTPFDTIGRDASGFAYTPAISRNGRYVAFLTNGDFDPADNDGLDIYIVDRQGSPTVPGQCASFTDVESSNPFCNDIRWLADADITRGCNPPSNTRFCPRDNVTRGQMSAFLTRGLGLTTMGPNFQDTVGHTFENDIRRLAAAGITRGCNPPSNTRFCPNDRVTRGQMAAFLVRALDLTDVGPAFDDSRGHLFETDIRKLAAAGITRGCNPPANTNFCPNDHVTREQMAAFLRRALEE